MNLDKRLSALEEKAKDTMKKDMPMFVVTFDAGSTEPPESIWIVHPEVKNGHYERIDGETREEFVARAEADARAQIDAA